MSLLYATHTDNNWAYDAFGPFLLAVLIASGVAILTQLVAAAAQWQKARGSDGGSLRIRPKQCIQGALVSAVPVLTAVLAGYVVFAGTYCSEDADECPTHSEITTASIGGLGVLALGLILTAIALLSIYRTHRPSDPPAEVASSSS